MAGDRTATAMATASQVVSVPALSSWDLACSGISALIRCPLSGRSPRTVAGLLAVHVVPGRDGGLGPLGVVVDGSMDKLALGCRVTLEGAEEAGLDDHGADPERDDLRGHGLDLSLDGELGRGVGGGELAA